MAAFSAPDIISIAFIFIFAGAIKGVTGMGLPTVSIGMLGLWMVPAQAAALLVIPSLVTNVFQFVAGANRARLILRLWPMLLAIFVATWLGTGFMTGGKSQHLTLALGLLLIGYATIGLVKVRLSVPRRLEPWLSPIIGAMTGLAAGATGVFVVPTVPYLQALELDKEDLVQSLGLTFTVSAIALAAGLASHGAFHVTSISFSLLCTIPALAGVALGQKIRGWVAPDTFRFLFFIGLMALGLDLAARSFF